MHIKASKAPSLEFSHVDDKGGVIDILNSDLPTGNFVNCDFNGKLALRGCTSKGAKLYKCMWPKTIIGVYKENQRTYPQLKLMMANNGYYKEESYYLSKEFESYYRSELTKKQSNTELVDFLFKVWLY